MPPDDSAGKNFSVLKPRVGERHRFARGRAAGNRRHARLRQGAAEFGRRSRADQIFRAGLHGRIDIGRLRHRADADNRAGHVLRNQPDRLDRGIRPQGDFDGAQARPRAKPAPAARPCFASSMVRTGTTGIFARSGSGSGTAMDGSDVSMRLRAHPCLTPRSFQALRFFILRARRDAAALPLVLAPPASEPSPWLREDGSLGSAKRSSHGPDRKEPAAAGKNASTSRPAGRDPHHDADGGGDAAHLRRRAAPLRLRHPASSIRSCSRSIWAGRRKSASTCSCGWRNSARPTACAPASMSASTCWSMQCSPIAAQADRPVRPVLRRAVHVRRRHHGREVRDPALQHRSGVARSRIAELDRLSSAFRSAPT